VGYQFQTRNRRLYVHTSECVASLAVLAVVAIGEEYGTGMIVVTFAND